VAENFRKLLMHEYAQVNPDTAEQYAEITLRILQLRELVIAEREWIEGLRIGAEQAHVALDAAVAEKVALQGKLDQAYEACEQAVEVRRALQREREQMLTDLRSTRRTMVDHVRGLHTVARDMTEAYLRLSDYRLAAGEQPHLPHRGAADHG
jgi:hypothetical protein